MRKLSESLISLDRIVSLRQIGLLARVGSTTIRTARECDLAERYALRMQIVIPASCPSRKAPATETCTTGAAVRHCTPRRVRVQLLRGQDHYHGRWPATTLRRVSSSRQRPCFTWSFREATVATDRRRHVVCVQRGERVVMPRQGFDIEERID